MNKKLTTILVIGASFVLAGCNATVTGDIDRSYEVAPTSIYLSCESFNLFTKDSVQLTAHVTPIKASINKYIYTSTNAAVATVSDTGVVTAVGPGFASITVMYEKDESIFATAKVRVTDSLTRPTSALDSAIAKQYQTQQSKYPSTQELPYGIDLVRTSQLRYTDVIVDEVVQSASTESTVMISDYTNGYFSLNGFDYVKKTPEGRFSGSEYGWTFSCDQDYYTHIYHIDGDLKTKLSVATQSFLGKGRIAPVKAIMNNIFTSGDVIMTRNFEYALSTSELANYTSYKSLFNKGGYTDDYASYGIRQKMTETADYQWEQNWYIPVGTKMNIDYSERMLWEDGICRNLDIAEKITYTIDGHNYVQNVSIQYSFEVDDEVTYVAPIDSQYRDVADIFEL